MTNDTKSAAERLRERGKQYHIYAGPTGWADENPGYVGSEQEEADIRLVAAACLAETDPTPVDQEWVFKTFRITINGAELGERFSLKRCRKGWGVYIINELNEYGEVMDDRLLTYTKTRGDVRKLAAALGIETKEAT